MSEIATLPVWKKGATPYERLMELAFLAKEHPENFEAFILVWRGTDNEGAWRIRTHYSEPANPDNAPYLDKAMGLLTLGQLKIYEGCKT